MTNGPLNFHNLSLKIVVLLLCMIVFLITFKIDAKSSNESGYNSLNSQFHSTMLALNE